VLVLVALLALGALTSPEAGAQGAPAGDPAGEVGKLTFPTSCAPAVQGDFERALAMLHSFWFGASTSGFEAVLQKDPTCAMAHWGLAMNALGNPFTWPPSARSLVDGAAAIERARAAGPRTPRERDYIEALGVLFRDHETVDHRTRALAYEKAMEQLAARYPDDREATIFYALALNATALPTDKTYANQLRAARLLEAVFAEQPQHPGVAHYLIHSYDYPPVADKGLPAARRYASIAPAAPHALHMPSHIFTRRGHWQESIESNRASAAAARNDFDRFHAMDYLVYAHLQQGQDVAARRVREDMLRITQPNVEHFVVGYAAAAIPSRYTLERGRWDEAAALQLPLPAIPWDRFPQAEAILVFARGYGAARSGDAAAARESLGRLAALRDRLATAKQGYWAEQVAIHHRALEGWIARVERRPDDAVRLLREAAKMEDGTEKHPVTPGPLVSARELLAELLLDLGRPAEALREFEATLTIEPNRFRTLWGAGRAAELAGDGAKARRYYGEVVRVAATADTERPELRHARSVVSRP
jgi:tetratricopeptide (TPR) repeat protein